ncbi:MAG: glycosyltransferase family 2 protein [Elusimicrobia bacterium]|nr:glycosyltransferase family 2 protein [Elusimicrobiota bacterium]
MNKLSAVLIVRNEEENIKQCLESIKWADDIILIDQKSTDRTVELARAYTDKIFITEPKGICNPDRVFGIQKAKNDWILILEADERVAPELKNEIQSVITENNSAEAGYYLPVKSFFCGRWIKHCGWYPGYILRLFRKGKVSFPAGLHTFGQAEGKCGYLKNALLHYSYPTISHYFPKFNRYTTQWAREEYKKGIRISGKNFIFNFLIRPLYWFFRKYFLLQGYRDGFRGFFISFSSALTVFVSYAKLWELQNKESKVL